MRGNKELIVLHNHVLGFVDIKREYMLGLVQVLSPFLLLISYS
jgi:hypothetical protein